MYIAAHQRKRTKLTMDDVRAIRALARTMPPPLYQQAQDIRHQLGLTVGESTIRDVICRYTWVED